jgi:hypothetical protein
VRQRAKLNERFSFGQRLRYGRRFFCRKKLEIFGEEKVETPMSTQLEVAKEMLFGEKGLRASNFKMYPGFAGDASAEEVASEVVKMLNLMKEGKLTVVAEADE